MAGARGFSATGSSASTEAGQQHDSRNGGIEGYVFKGLLFATLLAIALKLGPHIGTPTECLQKLSLPWHHCHGKTENAMVLTGEHVHHPPRSAWQADQDAVQQGAAPLGSLCEQEPATRLLSILSRNLQPLDASSEACISAPVEAGQMICVSDCWA